MMDNQSSDLVCSLNDADVGGNNILHRLLSENEFTHLENRCIGSNSTCWLNTLDIGSNMDIHAKNLQGENEIAGMSKEDLEGLAEKHDDQEKASRIYFSAGIYLPSLPLNGNYENVIELIDVNPDQKIENSPSQDNDDSTSTTSHAADQDYEIAFASETHPITNNLIAPIIKCEAGYGNDLQCLKLICNISEAESTCVPEYVDINEFLPKDLKSAGSLFLDENASEFDDTQLEVKEAQDDDVIFVQEYKEGVEKPSTSKMQTSDGCNGASPLLPTRRRRRRKTFGEKRKNPVRRTQNNRASLNLVEKLSIPSSVFNARVKKKIQIEPKNLRQSCRTSGAIYCPPSPLTRDHFREWPVEGMHEKPFYDEATSTILQFEPSTINSTSSSSTSNNTVSSSDGVKTGKSNGKRPIVSDLVEDEIEVTVSYNCAKLEKPQCSRGKRSKREANEQFSKLALDRVKMMFNYTHEAIEVNKLLAANKAKEEEIDVKGTVYERSLEFHRQQNDLMIAQLGPKFRKMLKTCKDKNIRQLTSMLEDSCLLYCLASGVKEKEFINLITGWTNFERKGWFKSQF